MKHFVEIAQEWGNRLTLNINDDVVQRAVAQNPWFTASEISLAISAITAQMLQPVRLTEWLSRYSLYSHHTQHSHHSQHNDTSRRTPQRTLIVMAGNLPLVGFFDLLCVVAAGDVALVKPSHKDRVLVEWAISELRAIAPDIPIYIYSDGEPIDRLIATGSDKTRAHFEASYPTTPKLLRGTRHSLAIITDRDSDQSIRLLQEDIFGYSGLGCRSVSKIFLPEEFGVERLPTGSVHPKHRNNYLRLRALLKLGGVEFVDSGTHCLVASTDFPSEIAQLSIQRYTSLDEVKQWIAEKDEAIQCIVASSETISHPRRASFGEAQHPTLFDYADGVDTMKFLLSNLR